MVWRVLASLHSVSIVESRGTAGLQQDLADGFEVHTFAETTAVQFGKLSDQEVAAYISTGTYKHSSRLWPVQWRSSACHPVVHVKGQHMINLMLTACQIVGDCCCMNKKEDPVIAKLTCNGRQTCLLARGVFAFMAYKCQHAHPALLECT